MTPKEKTFPLFIKGLPAAWDESATTQDIVLRHPPHIGRDPIHFRWWGTRYLISRENCAAIIALMTPRQLLIVHYRTLGMTDQQIAEEMGITPNAVSKQLNRLRQLIYQELPELRSRLTDRSRYQPLRSTPHL